MHKALWVSLIATATVYVAWHISGLRTTVWSTSAQVVP